MQSVMLDLLRTLMFSPRSNPEFFMVATLGFIVFVTCLNKVGSTVSAHSGQTLRSTVVVVVTLAGALALVAALRMNVKLPPWGLLTAAIVAFLAIGLPAACLLLKSGFSGALVSLIISSMLALLVMFLVHTVFGAFEKGGLSVGAGLQHRRDTEQILK